MPISLIAQFVPWFVFFTFIGYRPLELKIGVLTSLVLLLVLRLRSLKQLQWFDLGGMVFFFAMTVLLFFFYRPWLEIYADCFAGAMLSLMAWGSWLQDRPFTKFYTQACIKKRILGYQFISPIGSKIDTGLVGCLYSINHSVFSQVFTTSAKYLAG